MVRSVVKLTTIKLYCLLNKQLVALNNAEPLTFLLSLFIKIN